jgi:alpha-glucosidase
MNEPAIFNELKTMDPAVEMDHHGLCAPHGSLHNAYGLAMARATHEGLVRLRPEERVFLLSRAGYAGVQRYAFLWSGDNTAAWDHLRLNVTMAASMGLCGAPYFGADIGGYVGNPSGELMVRWIQAGTFVPYMRDHTGKGSAAHEPYAFPAELPILRKYLKLRYALMPYLYTAVWRASTEGEPINRPLFYDFGPAYLGVEHGFLFGRDLLVFPVLKAGASSLEAVFPEGLWYNLLDRKVHAAGKETVPVALGDIPVFVRGGCILPQAAHPARSTDELRLHRDLLLRVFPDRGGRAEGTLYEDDGLSRAHQKGVFLQSRFSAQVSGGVMVFSMRQEGPFRVIRSIDLELPATVQKVRFQGKDHAVKNGKVRIHG